MRLTVASSPHIRNPRRTAAIMGDVALALLPALAVGVAVHGIRALTTVLVTVIFAVGTEWLWGYFFTKKSTVGDGSALVTGLLLGMTLPHTAPYWLSALGGVFAIAAVKLPFGGLGHNLFNPALASRAFLLLLYPMGVTYYVGVDGIASATPLHQMVRPALPDIPLWDMFLGRCDGSVGEISALALMAGGAYLLWRRVISLHIPAAYLLTVAALTLMFAKTDAPLMWMLYSLLSGGLMLGAIFMATDYTTSPTTKVGQVLYGIGCGVLTVCFRYFGLFPEGVTYAILLMNALAWSIDRHTAPRRFGEGKGGADR